MSLLNVGARALMANQLALQTTGHNIANVNTAGYSRQTVAFQSSGGQNMGNGYIGNGADIATVTRNFSELLNRQATAAKAAGAADTARSQSLNQLQEVFSGGSNGLGAAVSDMMNAFADVSSAPTDSSARQVVLTRMSELAARFRSASAQLDEMDYSTRQQMMNDVKVVNSLSEQVAALNGQISRALATGHSPNDLLDQRDQVVRDINKYVQTSQVAADDGSVSLFVGGSQALVLGVDAGKLSLQESTEYPGSGKMSLYFQQQGGKPIELSASMAGGGEIAGLLQFQNSDLAEGRNLLGRMAIAIGDQLNTQNKLGLTLSGQAGRDLFKVPMQTFGSTTGAQWIQPDTPTVTVTDSSQLKASDYKIIFAADAPKGQVVRMSDGKVTPFDNLAQLQGQSIDGLEFDLKVEGLAGQTVLFKPVASAAHDIESLVHTGGDLAAANPVSAKINSLGDAALRLSSLTVSQGFAGALPAGTSLSFANGAGGEVIYSITPAPAVASGVAATGVFISGQAIELAKGLMVTLSGTPAIDGATSDSVSFAPNAFYGSDTGNASSFLSLRDAVIFDGTTTLSDGFSTAMAQIGTRTQSAAYAAKLSDTISQNLEGQRTAVSGVNLDEEAAKLLQYQQAYQASAKMLQVAQAIFDSVIQAVGR
ncbi:flagellar hook-associated protein FlgK [Comamonas sp. Y33R10-2]|uniref:flagellar hook-associated protein FlgK n=1 Tax=Comamonas sp. Y33R10-2 TaxID=2853257 RepID=UPI001C5CBB69|nr:flagellar hook-associated protein FlgK [Comamonas sp. Y33R10-2]QXZ09021.1 flagellar hook-associated protein FlgK [Comamonas sp. Y33R10-2]